MLMIPTFSRVHPSPKHPELPVALNIFYVTLEVWYQVLSSSDNDLGFILSQSYSEKGLVSLSWSFIFHGKDRPG